MSAPYAFTVDAKVGIHGKDAAGGYWSSFHGGRAYQCARCGADIRSGYIRVDALYAPRHYCAKHVEVTYQERGA